MFRKIGKRLSVGVIAFGLLATSFTTGQVGCRVKAEQTASSFRSASGFSQTQGSNNWRYQYATKGKDDYTDYDFYDEKKGWWKTKAYNWEYGGFHSGERMQPGSKYDCVITFTAPYGGKIKITANSSVGISKGYNSTDGVALKVLQGSNQLWPENGWQNAVVDDPVTFPEVTTSVTAGDKIYFRVNSRANSVLDDTTWSPVITYTEQDDSQAAPAVTPAPTTAPEPTSTPANMNSAFADIDNHWAKADILAMASQGIIKGVDDTHFAPDLNITRAEFAALIVRVLKLDSVKYKGTFTDIQNGAWYADIIQTAFDAGLIDNGMVVGNAFKPETPITREEMTSFIVNAYTKLTGKKPEAADISMFQDTGSISQWAVNYVQSAYKLGIISGVTSTQFAPQENATRAQSAVMIKRLKEKVN